MLYRKVDENGLFIEDVILNEQPMIEQNGESITDPYYIAEPVPHGFYHPKWNGSEWIEGLTDVEIDELTKPQPQEPTEKERLDNLENTILMLLMTGG